MLHSVTFVGDERYGDSPEYEMNSWSKGWDREDIVSVCKNADGSITVFYWYAR